MEHRSTGGGVALPAELREQLTELGAKVRLLELEAERSLLHESFPEIHAEKIRAARVEGMARARAAKRTKAA